jgi:hypothetical protein
VLAENPLNDYVLSSPAISDGQIFIRTSLHLYAMERSSRRFTDFMDGLRLIMKRFVVLGNDSGVSYVYCEGTGVAARQGGVSDVQDRKQRRRTFLRGLAALHSFWYEEGARGVS